MVVWCQQCLPAMGSAPVAVVGIGQIGGGDGDAGAGTTDIGGAG